jgi:c-di-GMP-binding flagellar brake protein YcgR
MNMTTVERRRFPRHALGIKMDIQAKGQQVNRLRGSITDLSAGGMTLHTDAVLDEGMSLHLRLNLPLTLRGEIRHSTSVTESGQTRYGVRFHKIDAPETEVPENFITCRYQEKA